jgi:DNA-binding LytR/AlgR family response regulator
MASNGIEAVELAARHQPQIAFLDIRMPGMGGIEAARQLYNRCHIVFATAYDQYAVDAFEHGAIDYLLKPVTAERLPPPASACAAACRKPRRTSAPSWPNWAACCSSKGPSRSHLTCAGSRPKWAAACAW